MPSSMHAAPALEKAQFEHLMSSYEGIATRTSTEEIEAPFTIGPNSIWNNNRRSHLAVNERAYAGGRCARFVMHSI